MCEESVGNWGLGLLDALSRIEDPRKPKGVRHPCWRYWPWRCAPCAEAVRTASAHQSVAPGPRAGPVSRAGHRQPPELAFLRLAHRTRLRSGINDGASSQGRRW